MTFVAGPSQSPQIVKCYTGGGNHSINVRISRTPLTDHYQQVFWVKAPVDYTSDLSSVTATRIR